MKWLIFFSPKKWFVKNVITLNRKKSKITIFFNGIPKTKKNNLFCNFGVLLKLLSMFCRESEGKLPAWPFWGWIWVGKWNLNCIKCSLKLVQIKSTSVPRSSGLMWLFICTRFNSNLIKFEFLYFPTLIHPEKAELIDIVLLISHLQYLLKFILVF